MKKGRAGSGASKRRAVEGAFHRLGMQARASEVVAALAQRGLVVSEEFVRLVRFGLLKAATKARVQPGRPRDTRPTATRRPTPAPRSHR